MNKAPHGFRPFQGPGQPQQIQIDLKTAQQKKCACGCQYFNQVMKAFVVPAVVSPFGKEGVVHVPVLICLDCKRELGTQEGKGDGK